MEIIMQVGMIGLGSCIGPTTVLRGQAGHVDGGRQWRENRGIAGKVLDWEDTGPNPSSVT